MKKIWSMFPLPLLPVVALPVVLFAPLLVTGKAIFWGTAALQFIPWRNYGWALLSQGQLPLWNPLLGMGAPLAANYQTAFFYPPNWIEALFWLIGGVSWQAWAQTLLVMLHLIWAGVGAALLMRRLGARLLGQTIAGMAFGSSGYLVARAGFLSINAAVSWLPWILLASWLVIAFPSRRKPFFGLVFFLAMQLLAGHAQTVWYSYLFAALWVGFWGWRKTIDQSAEGGHPHRSKISRLAGGIALSWVKLGLAIGLAAGLAAIQLLPTAEYLGQSQRASAVDFDLAMTYSFWPWRLLGLFAPNLFGNPAHGDYWGYANFWEDALYVGLLPALLALSVLLRPGRWPNLRVKAAPCAQPVRPLRRPEVRRSLAVFLGLVLLLGFILALGKNTPVFPWLYRHVPTFSLFQAPARYLIWIEIALVILAAMGADRWRRPEKRALYWTRLATAGGFAVSLGSGLAWYLMNGSKTLPAIALSAIGATALAGLWGLLAGGLSLLAPPFRTTKADLYRTRSQRLWMWGVIGLVGLDLAVAGWGLNPGVALNFYSQAPASMTEVAGQAGAGRLYLPEADETVLKFKRFLRFDTFTPGEDWAALRAVYLPDMTMLDQLSSVNNFDPLVAGRYARWMAHLSQAEPGLRADWLNLMATSVVETVDVRSPGGVRFEPFAKIVPDSASASFPVRLRWVTCGHFVPDGEAAWQKMTAEKLDYDREVVIENPAVVPATDCQESAPGQVELMQESPTSLVIQVQASSPGWMVLSDQWYPGWTGAVDGQPVVIERADFLFKAVRVEAGVHEVELHYRPISFWAGAVVSFGLLSGLLVYGLWSRSRRM